MKLIHIFAGLAIAAAPLAAQVPVYLDESKPIEERVEDAVPLDTSNMNIDEVVEAILSIIKQKTGAEPVCR